MQLTTVVRRVTSRALFERLAVRNFAHILVGNAAATVLQGLQFLILARVLGPAEFGRIAATSAVTAVLLPFSGAGAANVMVMRTSRCPQVMPTYFGNALVIALLTGVFLSVIALTAISPLIGAASSFALMSTLCISELLFTKLIDICGHVYIAREKLRLTGRFMVLQSGARVLAIPLFLQFSPRSALSWACWALASNVVVTVYVLIRTLRETGRPTPDTRLACREFAEGVHFSIGLSAKGFYTDADKAFLARFTATEIVGLYTSAFRLVQMALTPVRALAFSSQATFFRAGERGVAHSLRVAAGMAKPLGLFSIAIAACFFIMAPLLPVVLGPAYAPSVTVVRWLSLLPLLFAAQSLLTDALSGAGRQGVRALIQVCAAGASCVLNVLLIPRLGWRGAVLASYGAQLLLSGGLLGAALVLGRRPVPA